VDELRDEEWGEAWKSHFHVTSIRRRFVVKPSWESYDPPDGVWVLEIDPGQAFGTGLHETTRMCLAWLDELVGAGEGKIPTRGLDVGTGTGILAIALAYLGVGEVWALDDDPLATEAARVNVRANGVEERVRVVDGSLGEFGGTSFPLVVANLTGTTLVGMKKELARCTKPGGSLLMSGILTEEQAQVETAFEAEAFRSLGIREVGEWCAMLLARG
jgi:ribosomal protein L11 methyltransferase